MAMTAIAFLAVIGGASLQDQVETRVAARPEVRFITAGAGGLGRLDADDDGMVTREEFSAPIGAAFDRIDADRDGRLSVEELAAGPAGAGGDGRRVLMLGGSGGAAVSSVQVLGAHTGDADLGDVRIVTRGRTDGSGGPLILRDGGGSGGSVELFASRADAEDGSKPGGAGLRQVFVRHFGDPDGRGELDRDGDGKVSQDEFLAPLREAFLRMDADEDGFLDEGEGLPPPPSAE